MLHINTLIEFKTLWCDRYIILRLTYVIYRYIYILLIYRYRRNVQLNINWYILSFLIEVAYESNVWLRECQIVWIFMSDCGKFWRRVRMLKGHLTLFFSSLCCFIFIVILMKRKWKDDVFFSFISWHYIHTVFFKYTFTLYCYSRHHVLQSMYLYTMNAFDQCYRIMNLDSYEIARNRVFATFKQNTLWWQLIMVESKIKRKKEKYNNNKVQEKLTMTLADDWMYFVYNNNNVMCTIEESKMKHKNWQIAKSIIFFLWQTLKNKL